MSLPLRLKGKIIERPIIIGSIAFLLGKKADHRGHTHKWTVYVRDPRNEDLSFFIKKVVFKLHASFDKPKRVVEKPPFEISETGWGEFELAIRLYFIDDEKYVDLYHKLKLYPSDGSVQSVKKPVTSETFDEILFQDPTESLYRKFMEHPITVKNSVPHPTADQFDFPIFCEKNELKKMMDAHKILSQRLSKNRETYLKSENEVIQLRKEIEQLKAEDDK